MKNLLDLVIAAHGGMEKWNSLKKVSVALLVEGEIWNLKNKKGMFSNGIYEADIHQQRSAYHSLDGPFKKSVWRPGWVAFESASGDIMEELSNPRDSFRGQSFESPWNDLQPHYFCNYAWWTYFTAPFSFLSPGFKTRELDPWQQDGETWRRLEVTFPDNIETHNKVQIFYFNDEFLLKRHDYAPEILQSVPSSQYVWHYKEFSGIMMPTVRRIYLRESDSSFNPDQVMVSIHVVNVEFS